MFIMKYYPVDDSDWNEVKYLGLRKNDWRLNVLKKNPSYLDWGNNEDYMCDDTNSWNSPVELSSVDNLWELDDLNELVNFYFMIYRDSCACNSCDGSGLNPQTKKLYDDWYDFDKKGTRWCDNLTQDEVDYLWNEGRLNRFNNKPTAEEVNNLEKTSMIHDGINMSICVKYRAKKLGVFGFCTKCEGRGTLFTEDKIHLGLQMWFIHPRKGASRGVFLKDIEKDELNIVLDYLKVAQRRNNDKFSRL